MPSPSARPQQLGGGALCTWGGAGRPVVVLSDPMPGRQWLVVMPLGQPPRVLSHPLRPHLPLASVRLLVPEAERPTWLKQPPLLVADQLTSVATEDLSAPLAELSAQQRLRVRRLAALSLGLRPSDLGAQPPA